MKNWPQALRDGAVSGSVGSILSTIVLSACGQKENGNPYGSTNAISHWFWGDRAARRNAPSGKYTAVGYAIHHASATLWAVIYEKWFGEKAERRELLPAVVGGAVVAGLACFVDYKMTPERLQPGFEKRLSTPALFLVYASFGAGLVMRGLAASRKHPTLH